MKYRVEVTFDRQRASVKYCCDNFNVSKSGILFLKNVTQGDNKLGDMYISQYQYMYVNVYEMK